uniref:Immunoglobulin domain-containing protein n=1 Tax=Mus musculus TaxID=10090 RepID=Q9DAT6_MOUSE|nr:unnamed protein product [Mus musculus]
MGVTSELFTNVLIPWQRVLFTASLLTCWLLSTTASVTIQSPKHVVEGENILLQVDNLPENLLAFAWYRGLINWRLTIALPFLDYSTSMTGPEHSDREILYSNGSLWIQNVTQEDTGYYIFQTISNHGELESNTSTFLQVYSSHFTCGRPSFPAKLTIESVPPRVAEGGRVLLRVHNLPEYLQLFFWYKGVIMIHKVEIVRHRTLKNLSDPGPAHSGREIVFSNGSLLLQNVTWKDTGFYTLQTVNGFREMELAHIYLQVESK